LSENSNKGKGRTSEGRETTVDEKGILIWTT